MTRKYVGNFDEVKAGAKANTWRELKIVKCNPD